MRRRSTKPCSVEGCSGFVASRGLCNKHYLRARNDGSLPLKDMSPEARFWAKVDAGHADDCWTWKGASKGFGYGTFWTGERYEVAHRFAYMLKHGEIPDGLHIDHKCRNRDCVNPGHLHPVTHKQNMENLPDICANNTSGYRGVHFDKKRNLWRAYVGHNGKYVHAGTYSTAEDAARAAREMRMELFTNNISDRIAS